MKILTMFEMKILTMFQDKKGYSLTRIVYFLTFLVCAYIVIDTKDEDMFNWFAAIFATGYMGGKTEGIITAIRGKNDTRNNSSNTNDKE